MKIVAIVFASLGLLLGGCDGKEKKPGPAAGQVEGAAAGGDKTPATPEGDPAKPDKVVAEGDKPAAEGDKPAAEGDKPVAEGEEVVAEADKPAAEGDAPAGEGDAAKATLPSAEERVAGLNAMAAAYSAGDYEKVFAGVADDVVRNGIGDLQMPKLEGKEACIAFEKGLRVAFPDIKLGIHRAFLTDEWTMVQAVVTGTHTGPMGDLPATNKPFGIEFFIGMHHGEGGVVDRIDVAFDSAALMGQLGVIPMPAEAGTPTLVALPDGDFEVVMGERNEALEAGWRAWLKTFTKEGYVAAVEGYFADDFVYEDRNMGMKIEGKAANTTYLGEGIFGMLPDWKGTADHIVSVGNWLVVWASNSGTYAGGIPGTEATGQKVSLNSIDISQFKDGKVARFEMYGNGMQFMAQLGLMGGAGGDKPTADKGAEAAEGEGEAAEGDDAKGEDTPE